VDVVTYLEGRVETSVAPYAYLFVRPVEGNTCWLQGPSPLVVGPRGNWRTQATFGGSRGQRYDLIVIASEDPLHPMPFSTSDAYDCQELAAAVHRSVRVVEKR
jgi:hypothetical protein